MKPKFENKRLEITYIEGDLANGTYIFNVYIKDFDTPNLNVEYDYNEKVIIRTWIDENECDNDPKNHVVYKLFSLVENEVFDIMKFIVEHI